MSSLLTSCSSCPSCSSRSCGFDSSGFFCSSLCFLLNVFAFYTSILFMFHQTNTCRGDTFVSLSHTNVLFTSPKRMHDMVIHLFSLADTDVQFTTHWEGRRRWCYVCFHCLIRTYRYLWVCLYISYGFFVFFMSLVFFMNSQESTDTTRTYR